MRLARQRLQSERRSRRRSRGMRRVRQDATLADTGGAQGQYAPSLDQPRYRGTPVATRGRHAHRSRFLERLAPTPITKASSPPGRRRNTSRTLGHAARDTHFPTSGPTGHEKLSEHSLRRGYSECLRDVASIEDALSAVNDFLVFFSSARHRRVNVARFADLAPLS